MAGEGLEPSNSLGRVSGGLALLSSLPRYSSLGLKIMAALNDLIPDVDLLLELEPEELAGPLLMALNEHDAYFDPYDFTEQHFRLH